MIHSTCSSPVLSALRLCPDRGITRSTKICGGFSSRIDTFPDTTTGRFSFKYGPLSVRVREKHSISMVPVASSSTT